MQIKVRSKAPYTFKCGGFTFVPGINIVEDESLFEHTIIKSHLKVGVLEIVGGHAPLPSSQGEVRLEEEVVEEQMDPDTARLLSLNVKELVTYISKTKSVQMLRAIIHLDSRLTIRKVATERLKRLEGIKDGNS